MIRTKKTTRGLVITVINYDRYQRPENYETYGENHRKTTGEPQTRHTINKNEKNEKKKEYTSAFERFWNLYDKKSGKKQAFVEWKKKGIEENGLLETVFLALEKGVHIQKSGGDPQKVKDPERWIKHECYNDEPFKKKEQTFV